MRVFDIGARHGQGAASDRVLTVPNLLSFARLAVLPLIYLDLVAGRWVRALVLLMVFTSTDWFDGYLARRLDQITRLGTLLDPLSDRLLFVVVGVGYVFGDLLPLWALIAVVIRDVAVLTVGAVLVARGRAAPTVTRLGKAATFGLMLAFTLLLIAAIAGDGAQEPQPLLHVLAWSGFLVSLALNYVSAAQYVRELRRRRSSGSARG